MPPLAQCIQVNRRVNLVVELRETEERLRRRTLELERQQTPQAGAACADAHLCTLEAPSRLHSHETSHLRSVEDLVRYARQSDGILSAERMRGLGLGANDAPFSAVHLIDDFYIDASKVASDADADRVWNRLQSMYAEHTWNELLKRCIVPPMFGDDTPLQNLPGRVYLACALVYCILRNGFTSKRYARILPPLLRRSIRDVVRMVHEALRLSSDPVHGRARKARERVPAELDVARSSDVAA